MKISQRPNQDKWKYPKEPIRSFNTHLNIALHAVRFKPQQENNNAKNAGNFQDYEHIEKYAVALCHQITFISYGGKLPLWAGGDYVCPMWPAQSGCSYRISAYTISVARRRSTEIPAPTNTTISMENGTTVHSSSVIALTAGVFIVYKESIKTFGEQTISACKYKEKQRRSNYHHDSKVVLARKLWALCDRIVALRWNHVAVRILFPTSRSIYK